MTNDFPEPIRKLPIAQIPLEGVTAYISQADDHQIVFIHFERETDVPEHAHSAQWEMVLEGKVELRVASQSRTYTKGERFFIPEGVRHSALVHAGYRAVIFFAERDRYKPRD